MSVQVSWYDEAHAILYYQFEKIWKLDDMFAALADGREMILGENHLVDSVFDLTGSNTISQKMLASVRALERDTPENLRLSVAVGMNAFLKALSSMIANAVPRLMENFRAVNTLDEALALIRSAQGSQP